jgi:hypothetical protein
MTGTTYRHEFVEFIPQSLEEGVLYVSTEFATTAHSCMCGCGTKVVAPLSPTDWKMTFDGESVSLTPSIGNWSFACQSHYWLRNDRVRWARKWTDDEINAGREHDALREAGLAAQTCQAQPSRNGSATPRGRIDRLLRRLLSRS